MDAHLGKGAIKNGSEELVLIDNSIGKIGANLAAARQFERTDPRTREHGVR